MKILLNIVAWIALILYIFFAARYCDRKEKQLSCKGLSVKIAGNDNNRFITESMVKSWFTTEGIRLRGEPVSRINTLKLRKFVESRGYVKNANAYVSMDGMLNIDITQRNPMVRIQTESGHNLYITDDMWALPTQLHHTSDVPIVTGYLNLPFDKDYIGELRQLTNKNEKKVKKSYRFLYKLINFVRFLNNHPYWSSDVVQINVTENGDVELIPRIGNHVVVLGSLDGFEGKMNKLLEFYKKGLLYDGWNSYQCVDLRYKNQVVCTPFESNK